MLIFALRIGQLLAAFAGASVVIYAEVKNGWIVGAGALFGGFLFTELVKSGFELYERYWLGRRE